MYMLHLKELRKDRKQDHLYPLKSQPVVREDEDENSMNVVSLLYHSDETMTSIS